MKRAIAAVLAAFGILVGSLWAAQPAGATNGIINFRVNYHGIAWTGYWDNNAGGAECVYSVQLVQGLDGRAYAESFNFGYGIGACTNPIRTGPGYDWFNLGQYGTNKYRLCMDYSTWYGSTEQACSGWVGDPDPFNGINQYIQIASPSYGVPIQVCAETYNYHKDEGAGSWWEYNGPWSYGQSSVNRCVEY